MKGKLQGSTLLYIILVGHYCLIIIDYGEDTNMKTLIRSYHDLLSDYVLKNKSPIFVHTRRHI
jgi:hypothetical protein